MRQQRFTLEIEARDSKKMEILGTLSTENPVKQMGFTEILLHEKEAIDLSRGDLPLLEGHDATRINIGVVERLSIVGRKLKGILRFGSSARAKEIWNDIEAKIIRGLSIGYEILDSEKTGKSSILVTRWRPLEVSLVPVPADTGAIIGRSKMEQEQRLEDMSPQELEHLAEQKRKIAVIKGTPYQPKNETEFRSMGHWLQAVAEAGRPGGSMDRRLARAATGLSESVGSEGGFLTTTQFASDMFKVVHGGDVMSRVRRMTLTGSATSIKLPAIDETSRASTRLGGMVGYWIDEAAEKTASQPKFRQMEFTPNKVIVLCYATDELLADASMLESVIRQGFAEEIQFQVESSIVSGSGVGRPLGLTNAPAKITQDKEAGQAAASFIMENAIKMWGRLHPSVRKDAIWLINPDVEGSIWQFSLSVGTGGSAVFMASAADSPFSTLFGRPIVPCEHCQTLGTEGDIILWSPSQYLLVDKGSTEVEMSIHVRFIYDESVFRAVYRVSGQPLWHSALTPAVGSTTQSSIVTLESRT